MKSSEEILKIEGEIRQHLKTVMDPEVEVNIVDLGLIYRIEYNGEKKVDVDMTLSTPACPLGDAIILNVNEVLKANLPEFEFNVQLVWDPPWSPEQMTDEGREILGM
ncbi:MAG: metal-sulfur cluster assembly factor [Bacteroidota bacterium]|nr:metal-sulfur cluster assembly factor [Bacteroidota bacterium]